MKKITKSDILAVAQQLVIKNGIDSVTLAQVGKELGVSHAALYKHFANKQDLWTTLALDWLENILIDLFPFDTSGYTEKTVIAHDWLWTLAKDKMLAHDRDSQMFDLYTDYIDHSPVVLAQHTNDLVDSLSLALNTKDRQHVAALIQAFIMFSAPSFSQSWNETSNSEFEAIWTLIKPGVTMIFEEK